LRRRRDGLKRGGRLYWRKLTFLIPQKTTLISQFQRKEIRIMGIRGKRRDKES
jgi:hypothetical protein